MNKYQLYTLGGALLAAASLGGACVFSSPSRPIERPSEPKAADFHAKRVAEDKRERKREKLRRLGGRG